MGAIRAAATEPVLFERDDPVPMCMRRWLRFAPQRSPLILSGLTHNLTDQPRAATAPQRSPLILSGLTHNLTDQPRAATAPQRSPLILSGMTSGSGSPSV